jgi:hypothetical protein
MLFHKSDKEEPRSEKIFAELKEVLLTEFPTAFIEHLGDLDILIKISAAQYDEAIIKLQSLGFWITQDALQTESLCIMQTLFFGSDVVIQLQKL